MTQARHLSGCLKFFWVEKKERAARFDLVVYDTGHLSSS